MALPVRVVGRTGDGERRTEKKRGGETWNPKQETSDPVCFAKEFISISPHFPFARRRI